MFALHELYLVCIEFVNFKIMVTRSMLLTNNLLTSSKYWYRTTDNTRGEKSDLVPAFSKVLFSRLTGNNSPSTETMKGFQFGSSSKRVNTSQTRSFDELMMISVLILLFMLPVITQQKYIGGKAIVINNCKEIGVGLFH